MIESFRNIILKIQSIFRLLNVRNIRLFFFSLRNESITTTLSKILSIYKRRKTISYQSLYAHNGSKHLQAIFNIDCCTIEGDQVLIFGWIFCSEEKIDRVHLENTLEFESIWLERPELLKSNIISPFENSVPGFLLKIRHELITDRKALDLIFHSKNHQWSLKLNLNSLIEKKSNSPYLHFVKQYSKEYLNQTAKCDHQSSILISIVTPVYNTDKAVLEQTVKSVLNQSYTNWEWCIYDDGSSSNETLEILGNLNKQDKRIRIETGANVGMVNAYNKAVLMAQGEWVALLDHDDTLSVNALCEAVLAIKENENIRFLYTDEDLINPDGYFEMPSNKGKFSLDKILSHNYINHMMVIEKKLGDKLTWFRPDFEGAQDYDLILRIIECLSNQEIFYLDQILYHWRQSDSSINYDYSRKAYVLESGRKSLQDFYNRIGKKGQVVKAKKLGYYEFVSDSK